MMLHNGFVEVESSISDNESESEREEEPETGDLLKKRKVKEIK